MNKTTFRIRSEQSRTRTAPGLGSTIDFVGAVPAPVRYRERVALRQAVPSYQRLAARSRRLDILFSLLALCAAAPLAALAAVLILLESEGPVLLYQVHAGIGGRLFRLYRFRCVRMGDPRPGTPTCVGRLLRAAGIDRLPYLFSVLAGEISLVGPRPARPEEVSGFTMAQSSLLAARPGLIPPSRLAASAARGPEEAAAFDLNYVKNPSSRLYMATLFHALSGLLQGKGR